MYRKDVLLFKQDYTIDAIFHVKLEHILYEFTEYSRFPGKVPPLDGMSGVTNWLPFNFARESPSTMSALNAMLSVFSNVLPSSSFTVNTTSNS